MYRCPNRHSINFFSSTSTEHNTSTPRAHQTSSQFTMHSTIIIHCTGNTIHYITDLTVHVSTKVKTHGSTSCLALYQHEHRDNSQAACIYGVLEPFPLPIRLFLSISHYPWSCPLSINVLEIILESLIRDKPF